MPICSKVKNPCKICLQKVSNKTGLQCQGACKTWIHFECLNYTPGKIKDIQTGIINVSCPCPDCKTTLPKEYRTDEAYSCTNIRCPANSPPQCGNVSCPSGSKGEELPIATGCALNKCEKGQCKPNSTPRIPSAPHRPPIEPCAPPYYPLPVPQHKDACIDYNACPSGCSSTADVAGDFGRQVKGNLSFTTLEQMCTTVGQLTNQIADIMNKMNQTRQDNPQHRCQKPCHCPGNPCRK